MAASRPHPSATRTSAHAGLLVLILLLLLPSCQSEEQQPVATVGSKTFTESVILGEVIASAFESQEVPSHHRRQLGGTRFLWNALLGGDIDAYPEYTGTLLEEILAGQRLGGIDDAFSVLDSLGLAASLPLGFNNTYAIGMREDRAEELAIASVSDLRRHPGLRFGFSNEFMDRGDGWPSLRDHYRLPQSDVRGVDHDLAYRGLATGSIDVIDLYSTDAEIDYYGLRVLEDDLNHFPEYRAVILYRKNLLSRISEAGDVLDALSGSISDDRMIAMNRRVKIDGVREREVARAFVRDDLGLEVARVEAGPTRAERIWQRTVEHLVLVGISLGLAIVVAIPLGVVSARRRKLGQVILGIVGVIYTIPSLALLVFMIPLIGIGGP
ncbi:MAG: amino acid ABC transporter permease, partial [Rhodothermia bacterium]|nr:amino acid ABC transporter permease [Rhodothermia bacterium]